MSEVESRSLRYFVAVAEELSFARAARRLSIAPPALSRAIGHLEANLGVRLLERSTRHVALTDAGAALLVDARDALGALDAATRRARRAGSEGNRLVLAVKADVEGGLLEDTLAAYRAEPDAVTLEVVFTGWREQPDLVRAGSADVAIVLEPFDGAGLDCERLLSEPQALAMPAGHPLGALGRLRLADIEAGHERPDPSAHVYVPRGSGRPQFADMTQLLRQIELGRILALLPRSLAERTVRPHLTWAAVDDAPPATFALVWRQSATSLAVAAFVRVATAVAAGQLGTGSA